MIPKLLTIYQKVRGSLWATPIAMTALAVAAAIGAARISIDQGNDPVWFLYSGSAANARDFLSSLVTSMITMTTLAISITMVVLTLAAQQLGSRLIQIFMRDRHTQIALGLFVATVVYLLLVLRNTYGLDDRTPNLAVTIGATLVLASVITAIVFVHHLARSIIADNVIETVGSVLDDAIARLTREPEADLNADPAAPPPTGGSRVAACRSGYVQTIDFKRLVQLACEADCRIRLDVRPGHHVIEGASIAAIVPPEAATDALRAKIAGSVLAGPERTQVQDVEFSVRHLIEMAMRALSPGINDPHTAMAVVDRLAVSIGRLMDRKEHSGVWRDRESVERVFAPVSTFEGIADAAFNQIRQRAMNSPDVLIRMAEKLAQLISIATPAQRSSLAKHLRLVLEAGRRHIETQADLHALEARALPALDRDGLVTGSRGRT